MIHECACGFKTDDLEIMIDHQRVGLKIMYFRLTGKK